MWYAYAPSRSRGVRLRPSGLRPSVSSAARDPFGFAGFALFARPGEGVSRTMHIRARLARAGFRLSVRAVCRGPPWRPPTICS